MGKQRFKTKRERVDPVVKIAATILPPEQCDPRLLAIRDVANYSDDDQRAMTRVRAAEPDRNSDKARQTVRKLTRVELLVRAEVITKDQAAACEWYLTANELAFHYGQGTTANYCGITGSGGLGWDHSARTVAQGEARKLLEYARLAIPAHLIGLFDRIVIGPLDIRKLTNEDRLRFSLAAFLLHGQVGHLLAIAA